MEHNSSEIDSHTYSQVILYQDVKTIQWGEGMFVLKKWYWGIVCLHGEKMHQNSNVSPYTKINLTRIIDLNVKPGSINLPEENI